MEVQQSQIAKLAILRQQDEENHDGGRPLPYMCMFHATRHINKTHPQPSRKYSNDSEMANP